MAASVEKFSEFCISKDATFIDAIAKIQQNHSRSVLVLADRKVIGVLSEGDVLRALLKGADVYTPIGPYIQKSFKYLFDENYPEFLELVKNIGVALVPILHEDFSLKGVMRLNDLLARINLKG